MPGNLIGVIILSIMIIYFFSSTYHSENLILPLWTSRKDFGSLKLVGYTFSTSGDGKDRCDAISAIAKREVHKYVLNNKKDVTTEEELATALVR